MALTKPTFIGNRDVLLVKRFDREKVMKRRSTVKQYRRAHLLRLQRAGNSKTYRQANGSAFQARLIKQSRQDAAPTEATDVA